MIKLIDWKILDKSDCFPYKDYDISITGHQSDLDDRSKWVNDLLSNISINQFSASLDMESATLSIGNRHIPLANQQQVPLSDGKFIIDATSLEFPELIYIFKLAHETSSKFDVIYVEPDIYNKVKEPNDGKSGPFSRFNLSADGPGIQLLPSFAVSTRQSRIIVALGFEGHRFGGLLESEEYSDSVFTGLFGVPAFQPGMEMISAYNNADQLRDPSIQCKVGGANDPFFNYSILHKIYSAESAKENPKRIILAPIGTKPVALSMAWFAVNHPGIGVVYDFVIKQKNRTEGVGPVHVWSFG